jgi:2-haloacid dehalogenase
MVDTKPARLILFDVYETLLDMGDIEKRINYYLNSKRAFLLWFELLIQYTMVDNFTGKFHEFSSIADATLNLTAESLGEKIQQDQVKDILELMRHLPVQEDVPPAISALTDDGYRIAALTNSSEDIVRQRMELSGLVSYFEQVLSTEKIKKYKPEREVYLWAADCLAIPPENILYVSTHSWDLAGASNAGMKTAFVKRRRPTIYPLLPDPAYNCKNIADLCHQLRSQKVGEPDY